MKNQLIDLNNHLFAQLERVGQEEISNEELAKEVERTQAVCSLAKQIVSNAQLALDAQIAMHERKGISVPMIEDPK